MILGEKVLRKCFTGLDDDQYQANGVDLKLEAVESLEYDSLNQIGIIDGKKVLPNYTTVEPDSDGYYELNLRVPYIFDLGYLEIPVGCAAFYWLRSTLCRMGLQMSSAVGDSGFKGHIKVLVTPQYRTVKIKQGERVVQTCYFTVDDGGVYNGDYQENGSE